MILLIFAICVLNVLIGYAAAVYLGYGPPGVLEAWEALVADPPAGANPPGDATPSSQTHPIERAEQFDEDPIDEKFIESTIQKLNLNHDENTATDTTALLADNHV